MLYVALTDIRMHIQYKGTNYELTEEETVLTTKKIDSLKKYLGKEEKEVHAYITLGKHTEAHHRGDIWFAEGKIDAEGTQYFAKAESDTLRSATDKMIGELSREMRGSREKKRSLLRRGGAKIKRLFSRGS